MDGWIDDEHEHHIMLSCENGCNGLWTCVKRWMEGLSMCLCEGVDGGSEYVLV